MKFYVFLQLEILKACSSNNTSICLHNYCFFFFYQIAICHEVLQAEHVIHTGEMFAVLSRLILTSLYK